MRNDILARREELQGEFRAGEARLRDVEVETARLRETLLRISGAIQVLQELLEASDREPAASPSPSETAVA